MLTATLTIAMQQQRICAAKYRTRNRLVYMPERLQDPKVVSDDEYAARTVIDNLVNYIDGRNECIEKYCPLKRLRKCVSAPLYASIAKGSAAWD